VLCSLLGVPDNDSYRSFPYVVVPALNPLNQATLVPVYAQRAAATWIDAFLLSGSTTRGDLLSTAQRASLIDQWLEYLPAHRLIACCWTDQDVQEAANRQVPAMVVMRDLRSRQAALALFASLPTSTYVYSHPMYSPTVLDAALAEEAASAGVLPAGGKVAKIGLSDIATLRAATGPGFHLWDGSSRNIAARLQAGAEGVIATPLCHLPTPFPPQDLPVLQASLDHVQAELDALTTRPDRTSLLLSYAFGDEPSSLHGVRDPGVDADVNTSQAGRA
jgi:hypothetical protein